MKELTVDAKTESFSAIKSFVGAELEAMDCPEEIRQQLFVVIDEIFANIVSYAFAGGEGAPPCGWRPNRSPGRPS